MKFYTTAKISENMHETPEGYLVCIGVPIARTGEMVYADGETPIDAGKDGTVLVNREAEEVFRPETMASFEGKAITILHPTDFVSPSNWSQLAKGVLQNVRRGTGEQKNDLIADLLITDSVAINLVKNGLREVSCGYEANYTQTGEGQGIQSHIIGNHLALVDQGRAGSSYAINDHKGKGPRMKMKEKIKAIFARAQDEAMEVANDAAEEGKEKKDESKDEDKKGYGMDDVMKAVKDLGEKVSAMSEGKKGKDASTQPSENEPAKVDAKDDDVAPGLEDRLKKLEMAVAKILEGMSDKKVGDDDDGGDEMTDEDCEDDDFAESTMTGDTKSRVEILAPGLNASGKDIKAKALLAAYATTDGKSVIDQFTGGKRPDLKNEKLVETLFIGASEVLKTRRTKEFSATKTHDFQSSVGTPAGAMTAEKMNEINQQHYKNR